MTDWRYPEKQPEDPAAPAPDGPGLPVSERYAIVGEDTKRPALDKFTVGERTAQPVILYNDTIGAGDIDDPANMTFSDPIWVARGRAVTVWVKYTAPLVSGGAGLPHLFPQHSIGEQDAGEPEFAFVQTFQPPAANGGFTFASGEIPNLGPMDFPCFVAAVNTGSTASAIVLNGYASDAGRFVRFGLIDESTDPGDLLLVATVV